VEILSWDLETSSLNADYGIILCAGFKIVGKGKPEVISIADYPRYEKDCTDDKQLCKDISERLLKADCWLTHYGTFFDIPFLNTRLLYHGLPPVPPTHAHIDTWRTSRNRLKLRNNRLVTIQEFFETDTAKDSVKGPIWIKAISGDKKALQYVINHCRKDVLALEEVYNKLRPLIIQHPRREHGDCKVCGSSKLQSRGFHWTEGNKYRRFQCMDCGRWSRSGVPERKTSRHDPRPI